MVLDPPDFIIIPYPLLIDGSLQNLDRIIYGFIYWFEHMRAGKCTASNQAFAWLLAVDPGSVQNSLGRLEAAGYIKRVYKDEGKKVRTEIKALVAFKRVSSIDDRVSSVDDRQVSSIDVQNKSNNKKKIKEYEATPSVAVNLSPFLEAFKEVNPSWQRLYSNKTERAALSRLLEKYGAETVTKWIAALPKVITQQYAPQITTPYQLETKLGQLMLFVSRQKSKQPKVITI